MFAFAAATSFLNLNEEGEDGKDDDWMMMEERNCGLWKETNDRRYLFERMGENKQPSVRLIIHRLLNQNTGGLLESKPMSLNNAHLIQN